jgi:hypothetical protein
MIPRVNGLNPVGGENSAGKIAGKCARRTAGKSAEKCGGKTAGKIIAATMTATRAAAMTKTGRMITIKATLPPLPSSLTIQHPRATFIGPRSWERLWTRVENRVEVRGVIINQESLNLGKCCFQA